MNKIVKAVVIALTSALIFASCGSTSKVNGSGKKRAKFNQAHFDKAYDKGDYDACLAMLEVRDADLVLKELDSSMLQFNKKDYMESAREFVQVQRDMQQLTKDMTAGKILAAAVAGENSVEYSGATYERILAYSMKAVNAFKMGEVDRAIGVMNEYTGNYKEEISALVAAQKELELQSERDNGSKDKLNSLLQSNNSSLDYREENVPPKNAAQYEKSEFLAYLGTLAYAANGDLDHAKDFSATLKNRNLVKEVLSIPADMGRIDVVALSDRIGRREDSNLPMQTIAYVLGVNVNIKVAYPVFKRENQNHQVEVVRVTLSDGTSRIPVLIEDFDDAVEMDVASKAYGAYKRSVTRNLTKNTAALTAGITSLVVADKARSKASSLLQVVAAETSYIAAVTTVNKACAAVVEAEKADVRQGMLFPHKASAAGFTVAPGTYSVTVDYSNGKQDYISGIVVSAGRPTVVISECLNANGSYLSNAK